MTVIKTKLNKYKQQKYAKYSIRKAKESKKWLIGIEYQTNRFTHTHTHTHTHTKP